MSRLEQLDAGSWDEFTRAPVAVMMLARSTCPHCNEWTHELEHFLARDAARYSHVRFGKLLLDQPGLVPFKEANQDWLHGIEGLPFNVIYVGGERFKSFPGAGIDRLVARLDKITA